jgi:hypothetical protein
MLKLYLTNSACRTTGITHGSIDIGLEIDKSSKEFICCTHFKDKELKRDKLSFIKIFKEHYYPLAQRFRRTNACLTLYSFFNASFPIPPKTFFLCRIICV